MRVTKESGERWCVLPHLGVALFLEVGTTTRHTQGYCTVTLREPTTSSYNTHTPHNSLVNPGLVCLF